MNIKNTLADTVMEYICRILLIGTLIYLIVRWNEIPDQIPVHYNAAGEIDGWGGKGMVWLFVVITWGLYLGITFVGRFPELWNTGVKITKTNKEKVYRLIKYLIGTSKLILITVFTLLIVFTTLVKPLPLWFAGIYLTILIADMAFWLVRIFMERK